MTLAVNEEAAVKERPILFSASMVRALLDGSKTQTRRIIKHPASTGAFVCADYGRGWWPYVSSDGESLLDPNSNETPMRCPYGQPSDLLWVRETWQTHCDKDSTTPRDLSHLTPIQYPATYDGWVSKRRPGIHMPRWASRITLKITDVRVQRLQDISADDCLSEGVSATDYWTPKEMNDRPFEEKWWDDSHFWSNYPQIAFRRLWDAENGADSWVDNPFVWALSFEVQA